MTKSATEGRFYIENIKRLDMKRMRLFLGIFMIERNMNYRNSVTGTSLKSQFSDNFGNFIIFLLTFAYVR